ncbi:superoxide dismutase family protein [Novosphingobium cyanobacteriorum]|uniref:Superoxide dismutase family protein n=1 Tax=Novosphingobium cyanobacteriorum TaxID=3024215 RepID=A0ABT6CJA4_9SPHN|nr:superoxide dismutase family protein [Novosphingobium cyanobacteriorum]MDF8333619.1 superoxide dismutase family protein [Novosphingobium cyanobacteriorum]
MSRTFHIATLLAAALGTGACATTSAAPGLTTLAHADIVGTDGRPAGRATLSESQGAVSLTVSAQGLASGPHGIHLHAVGKCEGPAFTTAAGHLNPAMHQHGSMNPAGPHLGDLPNIVVQADGTGTATLTIPGDWNGLASAIFDADGTALVIHAAADDYKTDPSGNSGARIACGVFTRG